MQAQQYLLRLHRLRKPETLFIIPANKMQYTHRPVFYPFHQNSNLRYLTGINEPDCVLLVDSEKSILFREKDTPFSVQWEGKKFQDLDSHLELMDLSYLPSYLSENLKKYSNVGLDDPENSCLAENVRSLLDRNIFDASIPLQIQRIFKSDFEIRKMQESAKIASSAINQLMKTTRPKMHQKELEALFEYECKKRGGDFAYVPVISSGLDSTIIHYTRNNKRVQDGDLMLVDAGCQVDGYCSDISRCWPVGSRFTLPQRELYQAVLNVQKACIKMCNALESKSLNDIHVESEKLLAQELDLLNIPFDSRLYPHSIGHYLGLDLHDCNKIGQNIPLQEGMAVTIEPGLYIPDEPLFGRYRGIGIRIEDDIVVGNNNPLILSSSPKEIEDILNLRK